MTVPKFFLAVDFETTGLLPEIHEPMELAVVLLDAQLDEVWRRHYFLRSNGVEDKSLPLSLIGRQCDPVVLEMHIKSGLLLEYVSNKRTSYGDAASALCGDLRTASANPRDIVLFGNTVRFDASFMNVFMPDVLKCVHYRHLDVTAVRYGMIPVTGIDFEMPKKKEHRASYDVDESIAEFRFLWREFFAWCQKDGRPRIRI